MRFSILGPLEVVREGESLPLGGHRQRAVLARLLIDVNRVVSTDALVEGVWGESPPATAVKTLHKYVSELRKVLDAADSGGAGSVLLTRGRGYLLAVDADDVDALRFEKLVVEARRARAGGDPAQAASRLSEALGLWVGAPLADFVDEPFAAIERARLEEMRLAVLEEHLEAELALGHHRDAAVRLGELVEEFPLRERLWMLLMRALHGSGRQAEALRAFTRLRAILRDELGLEPSDELKQLELRILTGEEPPRPPTSTLPTGTVTFLLADVEDSTRLWEADAEDAAAAVAGLNALADDAVARHRGSRPAEQGEGDSFVAAFTRARDALACALDIQQTLIRELHSTGRGLRVRMALHTGDALLRDERNYSGPTLNRCARIRSVASGGQTLLSSATRDLVADDLPEGVGLRRLGSARLRGLERPEEVWQLCHPDLPDDFPPLPVLEGPRHNLPVQLTSFVGRTAQIAELSALVADTRCVTLTGVGGAGKTRLALEVAAGMLPRHPGGVLFVDLAPVTDGSLVTRAVADAVGVPEESGRDLFDALADALGARTSTLLMLDNCEHLLESCTSFTTALLARCPDLRLLVTSRQSLGVPGEHVWPVPPLEIPPATKIGLEELRPYESVRLFVDRARLAVPDFELTEGNREEVTAICRHLDGVPLALELAASQARVLEPRQIADRLIDRFRLLGRADETPSRSATLRATVEWSYQLLSDPAGRLFDRLSVFPGSFTLEAAEAVCGRLDTDGSDVLPALTELVDKSLLVREPGPSTAARYRLLETLRMYAREQLLRTGTNDALACSHAHYFLELAQTAGKHLMGPSEQVWAERLDSEDHNLRAALAWARENDVEVALEMGIALRPYWFVRFRIRDGMTHFEPTLTAATAAPVTLRARALTAGAGLSANWGHSQTAAAWAEEAIILFRKSGDRDGEARAQLALGSALRGSGQVDRAERLMRTGIATLRELDEREGLPRALQELGHLASRRGEHERAETLFREALDGFTRLGSDRLRANALWDLGAVACSRGDYETAISMCDASISLLTRLADRASIAHVRLILGDVARLRRDDEAAVGLYENAMEELRDIGDRRCMALTTRNLAQIKSRAGDHGAASAMFLDSMLERRELGDDPGVAQCLEGVAAVNVALGRYREAATMLAAADAIRSTRIGYPSLPERAEVADVIEAARGGLGADAFAKVWAIGAAMTPDEVVDYCVRLERGDAAGASLAPHIFK